MTWTVTYESYRGLLIAVREQEADAKFRYDIFILDKRCICSGKGFESIEAALAAAREKLDDDLLEQYDIELTRDGEAELKEFLEENFKDFDPDRLGFFVEELEGSKRYQGVGRASSIEIDSRHSKSGHTITFDAGDEYFQIRKLG